ncbi:hypothetical protein [Ramlibacter sp.]|uniref:hypothetical protein n=1 Tax=Ramlibacter sp. TaxID=1917967 RepID=UPI0026395039|nr:hypothetical protein [Ramlibacter sp.]MDB5957521.1 hypothetical protein [Ramlibacter sp.]
MHPATSISNSLWRFLHGPLTGGAVLPDVETVRAHKLAVADREVTRLAQSCAYELTRLVEQGALEHFLTGATYGSAALETTPAEWLRVELGKLQAEQQTLKQEGQTAVGRRRAEMERSAPLTRAVGELDFRMTAARGGALRTLDALLRSAREPVRNISRWQQLLAAGLTVHQMSEVMPGVESAAAQTAAERDAEVQKHQETLRNADTVLKAIKCWHDDPLHDAEHLRGIGIDDLVDAQIHRSAVPA